MKWISLAQMEDMSEYHAYESHEKAQDLFQGNKS